MDGMQENTPSTPEGWTLYAIGDVHGRLDLLRPLSEMISKDFARHGGTDKAEIIFLGDYVDRGMDSKGVIDFLLNDLPEGMGKVFLRGNHEDVVLKILSGEFALMSDWMQFGGAAMMASYGVNPFLAGKPQGNEKLQHELSAAMPKAHKDFLKSTVISCQRGGYFFAHAGVRPGIPLDKQSREDLMWIRHDFMSSEAFHGKVVVHGHTVTDAPEARQNRIGVDTGAYATGHLTCLALQGRNKRFIST